jgi:hypothetical protein
MTVRRFELRLVDKDGPANDPIAKAETAAVIQMLEDSLRIDGHATIRKRSRGVEPLNGYYLRSLTFHMETDRDQRTANALRPSRSVPKGDA